MSYRCDGNLFKNAHNVSIANGQIFLNLSFITQQTLKTTHTHCPNSQKDFQIYKTPKSVSYMGDIFYILTFQKTKTKKSKTLFLKKIKKNPK